MLGTVHSFAAANETLSGSALRDAFGPELASTGTLPGPFGYVGALGYYRDPDLALPLLSIRYYAPTRGMFVSRDPILSQPPYGYVGGLATVMVDPSGRETPPLPFLGIISLALCATKVRRYMRELERRLYEEHDPTLNHPIAHCMMGCYIARLCGVTSGITMSWLYELYTAAKRLKDKGLSTGNGLEDTVKDHLNTSISGALLCGSSLGAALTALIGWRWRCFTSCEECCKKLARWGLLWSVHKAPPVTPRPAGPGGGLVNEPTQPDQPAIQAPGTQDPRTGFWN